MGKGSQKIYVRSQELNAIVAQAHTIYYSNFRRCIAADNTAKTLSLKK